jgi:hypothetical protein
MNLSDYIMKRNGVPIGHPNSLRNNLQKSIGKTFIHFGTIGIPSLAII